MKLEIFPYLKSNIATSETYDRIDLVVLDNTVCLYFTHGKTKEDLDPYKYIKIYFSWSGISSLVSQYLNLEPKHLSNTENISIKILLRKKKELNYSSYGLMSSALFEGLQYVSSTRKVYISNIKLDPSEKSYIDKHIHIDFKTKDSKEGSYSRWDSPLKIERISLTYQEAYAFYSALASLVELRFN